MNEHVIRVSKWILETPSELDGRPVQASLERGSRRESAAERCPGDVPLMPGVTQAQVLIGTTEVVPFPKTARAPMLASTLIGDVEDTRSLDSAIGTRLRESDGCARDGRFL